LLASLWSAQSWAQARCYGEIVALYASGDHDAAVVEIGRLSEGDLRRALKALRGSGPAGSATCPERRIPIRLTTALMLHTDRMLAEGSATSTGGGGFACGSPPQGMAAMHVADLIRERGPRDVARRWTLAMALQSVGDGCLVEGLRYADRGLSWFRNDPALLFARGSAHEAIALALHQQGETAARALLLQRDSAQREIDLQRRDHLLRARASFEEAVGKDPELSAARLHLGRVLALLGEDEKARSVLGELLDRAREPPLLYLARLFLGRLHEEAGSLAGAEREYRAALDAVPNGQVAAVALSHVLLTTGEAQRARDVLNRSIALGERREGDSYWAYLLGASEAGAILAELRSEASPR
jgi:hypothetical protein